MYMMIAGRGCYNFYFLINNAVYRSILVYIRIIEALLELYWDVYIYIYICSYSIMELYGLYNYYTSLECYHYKKQLILHLAMQTHNYNNHNNHNYSMVAIVVL